MTNKPTCNCNCSTGIHDGLTFGHGHLDDYGFWEHPCWDCARWHELQDNVKPDTYWPFEVIKPVLINQTIENPNKINQGN